jgi:hypothetical protein
MIVAVHFYKHKSLSCKLLRLVKGWDYNHVCVEAPNPTGPHPFYNWSLSAKRCGILHRQPVAHERILVDVDARNLDRAREQLLYARNQSWLSRLRGIRKFNCVKVASLILTGDPDRFGNDLTALHSFCAHKKASA